MSRLTFAAGNLIAVGHQSRALDHDEAVIQRVVTIVAAGAELSKAAVKCGTVLAVDRFLKRRYRLADILLDGIAAEQFFTSSKPSFSSPIS